MKMTTGVAKGVRGERHSSLSFRRLVRAFSPKTEEILQSPIRIEINLVDVSDV